MSISYFRPTLIYYKFRNILPASFLGYFSLGTVKVGISLPLSQCKQKCKTINTLVPTWLISTNTYDVLKC